MGPRQRSGATSGAVEALRAGGGVTVCSEEIEGPRRDRGEQRCSASVSVLLTSGLFVLSQGAPATTHDAVLRLLLELSGSGPWCELGEVSKGALEDCYRDITTDIHDEARERVVDNSVKGVLSSAVGPLPPCRRGESRNPAVCDSPSLSVSLLSRFFP